ncbi:hypothetical protein LTR15_003365 [Elasticomyces elasticus]|nr:hypothetical protein LTR15_003365 [Elasticomyces elasticus]
MNTIAAWLARPPPAALDCSEYALRDFKGQRPGTHAKTWTKAYTSASLSLPELPLQGLIREAGMWNIEPCTPANIQRLEHYGPWDEADEVRMSIPFAMQEYVTPLPIANADEVRAQFCKFIDHAVQRAWSAGMVFIRHGINPPPAVRLPQNMVTASTTVLSGRATDAQAAPILVGEIKTPHVINAGDMAKGALYCSSGSRLFVQELRAYAHQYNTHDVFCYDSVHFVACLFNCKHLDNRDELLTCPVKIFIVPVASQGITVGRLLYLQIKRGDQRLRAKRANDHGEEVYGRRLLRSPSGRVVWRDGQTGHMSWEHTFLLRRLSRENRSWEWVDQDDGIQHQEDDAI